MMSNKTIITAVLMDENTSVSRLEICQTCNISEDVLIDMMEQGLFNHQGMQLQQIEFDLKMLRRIQTACRLQRDLGINVPGIVLILDLLEEIDELRDELDILQRHVNI